MRIEEISNNVPVEVVPAYESPEGIVIPGVKVDSVPGKIFAHLDFSWFSWAGVLAFLGTLWFIYTILAYTVSIILLILYIYASIRYKLYSDINTQALRDAEKAYELQQGLTKKSSRLQDVYSHIESDNPNDWKLAIIEADITLDQVLKDRGYVGNSLGERLRNITPNQLQSIQDAWEAHKIRNRIAHDGSDFVLTKRIAQETIARYRRVFAELGVE